MRHRLPRLLALSVLLALLWPRHDLRGAGWSPGERLPPLILSEINRRIAGSLRVQKLSWRVPDTIVAEGLSILDPEGKRVATAERLEAMVDVGALASRTLRVVRAPVAGLKLSLVVDKKGLNIARAFKTKAAPGDDSPLTVILEGLSTSDASVLFRKDDLAIAAASLGMNGELHLGDGKLRIETSASARRLVVQLGELKLTGEDLRLPSLSVSEKGLSTPRLDFAVQGLPNRVQGSIAWDGKGAYDLRGDLQVPAGYWPEGLDRPDLKAGAVKAALRMQGVLEKPELDLAIQPVDLEVVGTPIRQARGTVRVDVKGLRSSDLKARIAGGNTSGSASLRFKGLVLDAQIELGGSSLAELSRVASLSGVVDGTLRASGPLGDTQALDLDLRGTLRRFESGAVLVRTPHELRAKGRLEKTRLVLDDARLRGPIVDVKSSGKVFLTEKELNLELVVKSPRAEALLRQPVAGLSVEGLMLAGRATGSFKHVVLRGTTTLTRGEWSGVAVTEVQALLDLDGTALHLEEVRGNLADGVLEGQADIGLTGERTLSGSAQLASAKLQSLAPDVQGLQGRADLAAVLGGSLDAPMVTWTAVGRDLRWSGGGPYRALLDGELAGRSVRVQGLRLWPDDTNTVQPWVSGHVLLDLDGGALDGALEIGPMPVEQLPYLRAQGLGGTLQGEASLSGVRDRPLVFGRLRVDDLRYADRSTGPADAVLCLRENTLMVEVNALGPERSLQPCRPRAPDKRTQGVRVQTRVDLAAKSMQGQAWAREVPLTLALARVEGGRGLDGPLDADVEISGPLDRLQGVAQVRARRVLVDGKARGGALLSADLAGQELHFSLQALNQLEGEGRLSWAGPSLRGDSLLHLKAFAPEPFVASLRERGGSGLLDGTVQVRYDGGRQDKLELDARLATAQIVLPPARPIVLVAPTVVQIEGSRVSLPETHMESGGSRFRIAGSYAPEAIDLQLEGNLALVVLKLLTTEVTSADGQCSAALTLGGSAEQMLIRGHLRPQPGATITPRALGKPIEFSGGELRFADEEIRADAIAMRGLGGEAVLDGRVRLDHGAITHYDLQGRAENVMLRLERIRGEINADLSLIGDASAPALRGSVEVVEGRFRERYRLSNFIATASTADEGTPLAQRLPQLAAMTLDLQITGTDLRAHADMGSLIIDVNGSSDLRLGGTLRDPSLTGVVDVTEGTVSLLSSTLDVETATVDFPPRPDRRLVPRVELRASAVIEPAQSPTGAELPVELSLEGDLERMQMDIRSDESGERLSRAELLSLLATGRSLGALLNETSRDAAVRLVSRELLGDVERQVEGTLQQLVGGDDDRTVDLVLETGATGARTGLRWDVDRRLQFEGETSVSFFDIEDPGASDGTIAAGTLRHAVRGRLLLSDNLPIANSVAFEASATNLSMAANVYSTWDLKLTMRIFEL
ncbi:MAG: translocation/assembly module TamB domain-containing protein [Pseudomonadota bacterium]